MAQNPVTNGVYTIPSTREAIGAQFDALQWTRLDRMPEKPDAVDEARRRVEQARHEAARQGAEALVGQIEPTPPDDGQAWLEQARQEARATSVYEAEQTLTPEGFTTPGQIYDVGKMLDFARKQVNTLPESYWQAIGRKDEFGLAA